MYDWNSYC